VRWIDGAGLGETLEISESDGMLKFITASDLVLPGHVVLMRNREVVWSGKLDAPWDDVDCDTMIVNPVEFEHIGRGLRDGNARLKV